jgi:hypothetical protein
MTAAQCKPFLLRRPWRAAVAVRYEVPGGVIDWERPQGKPWGFQGSPFIAEAFQELFDRWQVFALLSPPRTPRYNGGVEAGNDAVKTRARQEAARHGRISCWTCDDLEAGQARGAATS